MKYLRLVLAGWVFVAGAAWGQVGQIPAYIQPGPAASGCTQATNFLARTSGLSGTETSAYTTMICGLVSDGIITGTMNGSGSGSGACGSLLDALYILATNNATTASLNLCGTSYSLIAVNSPTFAVDQGYTGVGGFGCNLSNCALLNTQFNPGTATTPNYSQNSASFGAYDTTSSTAANVAVIIGTRASSNQNYFQIQSSAGTFGAEITGDSFTLTGSNSNHQGAYVLSRTGAATTALYKNGSATLGTGTSASTAIGSSNVFTILAFGPPSGPADGTTDQISAAFIGGALTSSQAFAINNRINAYMKALGVNIY
jgi:hypothetical protein